MTHNKYAYKDILIHTSSTTKPGLAVGLGRRRMAKAEARRFFKCSKYMGRFVYNKQPRI